MRSFSFTASVSGSGSVGIKEYSVEGISDGFDVGFVDGFDEGFIEGSDDGVADGSEEGADDGLVEGMATHVVDPDGLAVPSGHAVHVGYTGDSSHT